jgi:hypothetical protein
LQLYFCKLNLYTMKTISLLLVSTFILCFASCDTIEERDHYQIKMYKIDSDAQESRLDQYLENAYIPALHRAGIESVGVFKPIEVDSGQQNYLMVFVPFRSLQEFAVLSETLASDETYQADGKDYIQASHDDPPYARIESFLLKSFSAMPHFAIPQHSSPNAQQVYELRSYEGATEQLYDRKVEMFNEGETALFQELEFNPVFFGEVISSAHMPHLMYLTTFSDTLSQAEHWDAFRVHPDWLEMKEIERYLNTVSGSTKYLLYPTEYSDI